MSGSDRAEGATIKAEIGRVPLSIVLPLRAWWEDAAWRQGWLGLFALAALAPFLLVQMVSTNQNVEQAAWGFSIYFAVAWLLAIRTLVRPEVHAWKLVVGIAIFTSVAGIAIAMTLERELVASETGLWAMTVGVGIPEEVAKAIPLMFIAFHQRQRFAPRTFLYLGVVSGLSFGATEAVMYSSLYSQLAEYVDPNAIVWTTVWRLVSGSLLHACLAGVVGFFIGLASQQPRARRALLAFGLGTAGLLHGAYNTLAGGWWSVAVAAGIVFVFVGYVRTGDRISDEVATA